MYIITSIIILQNPHTNINLKKLLDLDLYHPFFNEAGWYTWTVMGSNSTQALTLRTCKVSKMCVNDAPMLFVLDDVYSLWFCFMGKKLNRYL